MQCKFNSLLQNINKSALKTLWKLLEKNSVFKGEVFSIKTSDFVYQKKYNNDQKEHFEKNNAINLTTNYHFVSQNLSVKKNVLKCQ